MLRRFDQALMQPPAPHQAVDAALLASLCAWCMRGVVPQTTEAISIASIAPHPALDAAACALDGSHALARLGRWRGLAWRLQILLRDHLPGRSARPDDPWDCGWWRAGPLAAAAAFRPRRATLLLVREPDQAVADALLATLRAQSPAYGKPLRVLLVCAVPAPGLPRLQG